MDDSQSPGDIAHASCLNDGQLLSTPLSNYLYRFVSVHVSGFFSLSSFLPLCSRNPPCRGKSSQFVKASYSEPFCKTNEWNFPCGVCMLSEAGGENRSRKDAVTWWYHFISRTQLFCPKKKTKQWALYDVLCKIKGEAAPLRLKLHTVWTLIITHTWALLGFLSQNVHSRRAREKHDY